MGSRYAVPDIAVRIQRGGGKWPYEAPATIGATSVAKKGAKSIRFEFEPERCDEALHRALVTDIRRGFSSERA
jgi:hypothetical protein